MALIDTVRRLAKLGFYFGLGAVTAAFDACGDGSSPGPDGNDARPDDTSAETAGDAEAETSADAEPDVVAEADAEPDVAAEADAEPDVVAEADAEPDVAPEAQDDGDDMWDVVFE
jgi:hypothetical protein